MTPSASRRSAFIDQASPSSIQINFEVALYCDAPDSLWDGEGEGTLVEVSFNLETHHVTEEMIFNSAWDIVEAAVSKAGLTASGLTYVDIRYRSSTPECWIKDKNADFKQVDKAEASRFIDQYYYKQKSGLRQGQVITYCGCQEMTEAIFRGLFGEAPVYLGADKALAA